MRRSAAPIVKVNLKRYKHLAVLTVAITFCIAMFSNGEGRAMIEDQSAARQ